VVRPRVHAVRLAALALGFLIFACRQDAASSLPTIKIRSDVIHVDVARTPEQRARGLGGRESLAPNAGMAFPFDEPGRPAFWMAGMYFDIDIVWIRGSRVVDLSERLPHPPPELDPRTAGLPEYRPREPVDLALEVPAGTVQARGWARGDMVELSAAVRSPPQPRLP
jgi:uncharacterized membrane protein (UPF0127 family)